MSKAYLHVGMHKTGTTTIQRHLHSNRRRVRELGLFYLDGPEANHSLLILSLFENDPQCMHGAHFRRPFDRATYLGKRAELYDGLIKQADLAASSDLPFLISGEAIYHLSREGLVGLRATLSDRFDDVIVVGLVRPPLSFAESYSQEALKLGRTYADFMMTPPLPKYRKRFGNFIDVFGSDKVRLDVFVPQRLIRECPLQTLIALMDLAEPRGLEDERPLVRNASLSMTAAKTVSLLNQHRPRIGYNLFNRQILNALRRLEGPPATLPEEIRQKVIVDAEEDVRWMSEVCGTDLTAFDRRVENSLPLDAFKVLTSDEVVRVCLCFAEHADEQSRAARARSTHLPSQPAT